MRDRAPNPHRRQRITTDAKAQETGVAAETLEYGAGKSVKDACSAFLAKRGGGPVSYFTRRRKLPPKDVAAG